MCPVCVFVGILIRSCRETHIFSMFSHTNWMLAC